MNKFRVEIRNLIRNFFIKKVDKIPQVIVVYWAESELAFLSELKLRATRNEINLDLYYVTHHSDWFKKNRSLIKNFLHHAFQFSKIIFKILCNNNSSICVFGTNACRIISVFIFFRKNVFFVYNEIPDFSNNYGLKFFDNFIFTRFKCLVSNRDRAAYIGNSIKLDKDVEVLENVTFRSFVPVDMRRREGCVYFGTLTPKRFSHYVRRQLEAVSHQIGRIDVYGKILSSIDDVGDGFMSRREPIPHNEVFIALRSYKYALLSYHGNDPNYVFCAPLKIFEYIKEGCIPISVFRNESLLSLKRNFSMLIFFIDEIEKFENNFCVELYNLQREQFLRDAIKNNINFALKLTGI